MFALRGRGRDLLMSPPLAGATGAAGLVLGVGVGARDGDSGASPPLSADCNPTNPNPRPVAGLFAAGRAACGIASQYYVSGLSLADAVFSGRRAGAAVGGVTIL